MTTQLRSGLSLKPIAPDDETALREWFVLEAAARVADRPDDPAPCWTDHQVPLSHPWPGAS